MAGSLDVVCFSYLAEAEVLRVAELPVPNEGAVVLDRYLVPVADGVAIATALSDLGLRTGLLCNDVGSDERGRRLWNEVHRRRISTCARVAKDVATPSITVIVDRKGRRSWLAYIPDAVQALHHLPLALLRHASLAYVDLYEVIHSPGLRVLAAAHRDRIPVFVNLGERQISDGLLEEIGGPIAFLQISLDPSPGSLEFTRALFARVKPGLLLATLGEAGVIGLTNAEEIFVPGFSVPVRNTNNAGAAFSAGFLFAYFARKDLRTCLTYGCAAGAMQCSAPDGAPAFTAESIGGFLSASRARRDPVPFPSRYP